jgi:hypothetical protein
VLAALAITFVPAFSIEDAAAGTLAQLQLQSRAVRSPPHMDLCVGGAHTPHCRAALDTALHPTAQTVALKGGPQNEAQFYSSARFSNAAEAREPLPLKFNIDPEWKKRAIVIAHEGLTFLRMPEGANHEFIVGINRHGMLGFSLKDTTGE